MRTSRQQLYDNFYYGFERWLIAKSDTRKARKRLKGIKFDKQFYHEYKNSVCPYWAQFGIKPNIVWVKYNYLLTGSMDPRYIPNDILATRILPHFNNSIFVRPLADKNLNNLVFPGMKRPKTAFKYMSGEYCQDDFSPISKDEAMNACQCKGRYFIKPTRNSSEGNDIRSFPGTIDRQELSVLLERYRDVDYIVQHGVTQHADLAALNESSVNTIRLITLLFQGKPHILSSILRIGNSGCDVDNIGAGGYQCSIRPDGTLDKMAYTHQAEKDSFVAESRDGIRFEGIAVPSYNKVCSAALEYASKAPHLKYIAWDFAIDQSGDPVMIEFNANVPGQNQETCGPTFGDLTDAVLAEVFNRKNLD